jgi:spore germination cell wall hydrolase CwlJ-like protein
MTASEVEKSLDCLAINVYREAGHEPFEGKVAVAQVTLNRVNSNKFPRDVCAVVYQKTRFTERVICQFSWYCDSKHRNRPVNDEAYEESYRVAKMVFLEDFRLESIRNALYYHADYVNPNWKLKRIAKIGTHIFYEG